jgi:hypothetical protein
MISTAFKTISFAASLLALTNGAQAQVTATFPNGVTNPDVRVMMPIACFWPPANVMALFPHVCICLCLSVFDPTPITIQRPEIAQPGAVINQTSDSRLITLNSVDDFCIYGPPEPGPESLIGNVEPIVVAYCTKPRNGARLIPDGTIHSAHVSEDMRFARARRSRELIRPLNLDIRTLISKI